MDRQAEEPQAQEQPAEAAPAAKKTARKTRTRRAPARAPRRDWAAEAAATPIEAPAPEPASLAVSPAEESETQPAPATKRRRGTRGGRGRKKSTAKAEPAPEPQPEPEEPTPIRRRRTTKQPAPPPTLEELVARQAEVLQEFARETSSALRSLQATVADLQGEIGETVRTAIARDRVGIFVDVPNVIYAAERRGISIDFGRVLEHFTRGRQLVRASAYAPISDDPAAKLETQRFVHHFVGHPYRIITKPLKRFADGSMKANFDIELAIDILTMSDRLDVVVLMSGDGDFRRLVEMISSRGVRVEVVAFGESASSELKAAADLYVDVGAHLDEFRAKK